MRQSPEGKRAAQAPSRAALPPEAPLPLPPEAKPQREAPSARQAFVDRAAVHIYAKCIMADRQQRLMAGHKAFTVASELWEARSSWLRKEREAGDE